MYGWYKLIQFKMITKVTTKCVHVQKEIILPLMQITSTMNIQKMPGITILEKITSDYKSQQNIIQNIFQFRI